MEPCNVHLVSLHIHRDKTLLLHIKRLLCLFLWLWLSIPLHLLNSIDVTHSEIIPLNGIPYFLCVVYLLCQLQKKMTSTQEDK